MSTTLAKTETVVRKWHVVDAAGKPLGRTAVTVANLLRGKHKVDFTPNVDCGDYVIVINTDKAILTAGRSDYAMELAVKGMLPKNTLGRHCMERLHLYKGAEHPHAAQKPEAWTLD